MKLFSFFGIVAVSISALFLFCSSGYAEINLTGDLEIDTSYKTTSEDPDTDMSEYDLDGRIKIVPTVRKEAGRLYFEAKAEILAKTDGGMATDDVWGKIGTSGFDVQIGRFEAWSLFDKTNDMLIVEAPGGAVMYEANYARGRMDSVGQLALHAFSGDIFGFEAGLVYGNDGDDNVYGLRPVINTKFGNVEIVAGVDLLNITPKDANAESETTKLGYGAKVKAVFGMATLGINYASGTEGGKDAGGLDIEDATTNSLGAYCDLALGKGVLSLATFLTDWEQDNNDFQKDHIQYFIAYAHPLPIDGATIKFAVSQATATQETATGDVDSDALAFKVRLNYNF